MPEPEFTIDRRDTPEDVVFTRDDLLPGHHGTPSCDITLSMFRHRMMHYRAHRVVFVDGIFAIMLKDREGSPTTTIQRGTINMLLGEDLYSGERGMISSEQFRESQRRLSEVDDMVGLSRASDPPPGGESIRHTVSSQLHVVGSIGPQGISSQAHGTPEIVDREQAVENARVVLESLTDSQRGDASPGSAFLEQLRELGQQGNTVRQPRRGLGRSRPGSPYPSPSRSRSNHDRSLEDDTY